MKQRKNHPKVVAKLSVSMEPELMQRAKAKALSVRRNFSNYVQVLIEQDLERESKPA